MFYLGKIVKLTALTCIVLAFLFVIRIANLNASEIPAQLSFSIGSISTSFAESESNLTPSDGTTTTKTAPYSGASSSMPIDLNFEYFTTVTRSYFLQAGGPLMASTPDRLFYTSGGVNFYFSSIGAPTKVTDENLELKITPKFRYYAGPHIGVAYLVYNTKSQTKNDIMLDIGGQAGVIYSINKKWSLRGQAQFSRETGAIVTSTSIKILFGGVYNFNTN